MYQANSDYYFALTDMPNLFFKANLFENTDSMGRFIMYVSNVVLNVNMFLAIRSIKRPFGFELISENVKKNLGMERIQTITLYLMICQILLFKAVCLKVLIPPDDLHDTCRMLS